MKDDKIKELFKALSMLEKLLIRIVSLAGWVKILIDIFAD